MAGGRHDVADIRQHEWHVRLVPLADIRQGRFATTSRPGSAEPAGVPEAVVGKTTLGISGESGRMRLRKYMSIASMCLTSILPRGKQLVQFVLHDTEFAILGRAGRFDRVKR